MKKRTKLLPGRICLVLGFCLLVLATVVLASWLWGVEASQQRAVNYVHTIRTLIPQPQGAAPEERSDNTMAALSMDGTDFIGILEMPTYGSALPVCADWGESGKYPCRLAGSIYDRTMQIGGTTQKGQYDFYREISVGDTVFFTDMEGNRFSYEVTSIRYAEHADQSALRRDEAALTLFIQNIYGFEYIVIFCNTAK